MRIQQEVGRETSTPTGTVALDYNKRWADRAPLLQVEWHEATSRGGQRLLYNKGWAPANPKFNAAYLNAINPQVSGRNLSAKYKNLTLPLFR